MKNTNKRKYLRLRTLLGLFLLCTMLLVTVRTEDYCANDNAALKEYLTETCYTGGYLLSDNTWVWYIEGNEVTKEVYVKKLAEDYDAAGWDMVQTTISDGTKIYCLGGNVYYSQEECEKALHEQEKASYEQEGYFYATTESEAKAYIDAWYDKNNTADYFKLAYRGTGMREYYESKQAMVNVNSVSNTYRHYVLRTGRTGISFAGEVFTLEKSTWDYVYGNEEQVIQAKQVIKNVANTLKGKSTYEQIKGAYEWLCNNIVYDSSLQNHTLYSAMITKSTVCEGYAMAMQLFMEELGIESYIVTGTNHAWNAVRLDGQLYWVDATWGDQESYINYSWLLCGTNNRTNNTHLSIATSSYNAGGGSSGNVPQTPSQPEETPQPDKTPQPEETPQPDETQQPEETEKTSEVPEEITTEESQTEDDILTETEETITEELNKDVPDDKTGGKNPATIIVLLVTVCMAVGAGIGGIVCFVYIKKKNNTFKENE